jgi:hypothetical protein
MNIPKGYTEAQVLEILDGIVDYLAPSFTFGYYDIEDIKQEGRIYGIEALGRYDKNRGSKLKNFLYTHIQNRFINLKRDKLARPNPCNKCLYYTDNNQCMYDDKMDCPKYYDWLKRNSRKRNLIEPINNDADIIVKYETLLDKCCRKELLEIIDNNISVNKRRDFLKLLEGCSIPPFRKTKLLEEIKQIIAEHYDDGAWSTESKTNG